MRFGSRYTLKDLREINRLSIKQVADNTGISVERLNTLEHDSSNISGKESINIVKFYRISLDYIFLGKQTDFDKKLNNYLGGTQ